jgi:hypothetical protein
VATVVVFAAVLGAASLAAQTSRKPGAPERFSANATVATASGAGAATVQIAIQRYTPDADRGAVESALKGGGYPAFLTALRKAPEVGTIEIGGQKFAIRYARQTPTPKGRVVVVVTDKPMFFVGGADPDAKPRAGFEVGVVRLELHEAGIGTGIMAAAAKVKPDPENGVQVEDYAQQPIKLEMVRRNVS